MDKSGVKLTLCFQGWVVATVDARPEGLKCESGGGVLGRGQRAPSHQLGGWGRAVCKLPQRVRGGAPTANASRGNSLDHQVAPNFEEN